MLKSKPDEATYMAEVSKKLPSVADQPSTYIKPMMEDLDDISIDLSNPNHKVLIS